MKYNNDMKTESIKTEQDLNLRLAELEIKRLQNKSKRARSRFIDDVVFLILIAVLVLAWLSAPHVPGELGKNISHLASSAWQLLPFILIVNAFKRVVSRTYHHIHEEA
jgi:Na+/H+ antiporter NhaC